MSVAAFVIDRKFKVHLGAMNQKFRTFRMADLAWNLDLVLGDSDLGQFYQADIQHGQILKMFLNRSVIFYSSMSC